MKKNLQRRGEMKVIKIVIYSLIVALIAQTFIIGCPTCFKPESSKQNPSEQAGGNEGKNVTGEMGNGSNQSNQNNPFASVIAAQTINQKVQP
jgi:hypothetical protein